MAKGRVPQHRQREATRVQSSGSLPDFFHTFIQFLSDVNVRVLFVRSDTFATYDQRDDEHIPQSKLFLGSSSLRRTQTYIFTFQKEKKEFVSFGKKRCTRRKKNGSLSLLISTSVCACVYMAVQNIVFVMALFAPLLVVLLYCLQFFVYIVAAASFFISLLPRFSPSRQASKDNLFFSPRRIIF